MGICAAPHCDVSVDDKYLMCPRDWYRLPKPLRTAVNQTWLRVHRDRQSYTDARDAAVQWHIENPPANSTKGPTQESFL